MTDEIAALEAQEKALQFELDAVRKRLHAVKLSVVGVSVGDIVRSKGKRFRVVEVDPYWSPPWLVGNPERADGTFGTARRNLFDEWARVT